MAVYFFDSSALVKRYLREPGSTWVGYLSDPKSGNKLYITKITGVEVIAALMRKVRDTTSPFSLHDAQAKIAEFRNDFEKQYELFSIDDPLIQRAMALPEKHKLRGYDAVQLAAALIVSEQSRQLGIPATGIAPLVLVASDKDLLDAAQDEGLAVDDPSLHP